jgi:hypothetical protein
MLRALRAFARFVSAARAAARAAGKRGNAARLAKGRGSKRAAAAADELIEEAISLLEESEEIILAAYIEAIAKMISMVANPGQASVMQSEVIPGFEESYETSDPETGWEDVDIGEYMTFMGEIVSEGNSIMSAAYGEASSLILEASDILG